MIAKIKFIQIDKSLISFLVSENILLYPG